MNLTFAQVQSVALGAARIAQQEDGIHFYRFTQEQENLYRERNAEFYAKTFCTSGVQLRFRTDSRSLGLKVLANLKSSRRYYSVDVFVNGEMAGCVDNFSDVQMERDYTTAKCPLGEAEKAFNLGEGEKEITIYLPWSVEMVLQEIALDDGASLTPVKPKHKMLCFGDSITHGYDALRPSNKYITKLARALDAEEYNKAIGGEIFFPALANAREDFAPDYISVAYGTNDWSKCEREELISNCKAFYANLRATYPEAKIFAITPVWRKDYQDYRKSGLFTLAEETIREATKDLPNVQVIYGFEFVPHDEAYYADLRLHPNDEGFEHYFQGLWNAIR